MLVYSFPCLHKSLQSANLVRWGKDISSPGVMGQDLSVQLQESLDAVGCPHKGKGEWYF